VDYRKKLKQRLYIAIAFIALGVIILIGFFASKSDDDYISALGFSVATVGAARSIQYFRITRSEESIKKQRIKETDERNLSIIQKAKSTTFSIFLLLTCAAVVVTSLFEIPEVAKWIGYLQLVLMISYWGCYWIYQKIS